MQLLFWNPMAINYLIESLLVSVFAVHLGRQLIADLRQGGDVRNSLLVFLVFAGGGFGIVCQFLAFALHPDYVDYPLPWVGVGGAIAMAALTLFAFHFGRRKARPSWIEASLTVLLLAIVAVETVVAIAREVALASGRVEYRDHWIDVPSALGFILPYILFFRTIVAEVAHERDINRWRAIGPAVLAVLWPPAKIGFRAAGARAFLNAALLPFLLALTQVTRSLGWSDWRLIETMGLLVIVLTFAGFALAYLNYVPERSSFRTKLVGISLTSVLVVVSGVTWLIGGAYVDAYRNPGLAESNSAIRFAPQPAGSYLVTRIAPAFEPDLGGAIADSSSPQALPFAFPFYTDRFDRIFVSDTGMVGFQSEPRLQDVLHRFGPDPAIFLLGAELRVPAQAASRGISDPDRSGLFIRRDADAVIVTWNRLVSAYSPKDEYTAQLKLHRSGVIDMVFAEMPEKPLPDSYQVAQLPVLTGIVPAWPERDVASVRFASDLPFTGAPGQGLVAFHRLDLLAYLDRIYAPVAYFILAATFVVLVVFPSFFNVNLVVPLRQLIAGVQHILDGRLNSQIPVFYRDEVGFLAASFNEMARTQNELTQTLEEKVMARTAEASELAARNARLEERNRLARDLHDSVNQTLFSANLIADTLPELFARDPVRAQTALAEFRELSRDALSEMRSLLLEMRPGRLVEKSLGQLLRELADEIGQRNRIRIEVNCESDLILPVPVKTALYRIAQECLNNVVKHAEATEVKIDFDSISAQALLTISDNGKGFVADAVPAGHIGLQIISERMTEIGGALEIRTAPSEGTTVTAIWFGDDSAD